MNKPESDHNLSNNEIDLSPVHILDTISYNGRSERIKGFRRIKEVIRDLSGIQSINPTILPGEVYQEYQRFGMFGKITGLVKSIWDSLEGNNHHLIVRRLFPDANGNVQSGPRSGNVTSDDELLTEIEKLYKYYDQYYVGQDVLPEIMIHRIIDVANPPKEQSPFLPHPGGDVIYLGAGKFQVRATFGADESVQGFPSDIWEVEFRPDNSLEIHQTIRAQKTGSVVPAENIYSRVHIPKGFQDVPALSNTQVLSIAEACRRITELHGPHRLEFDGTNINGQDLLVIIESAPFLIKEGSKEVIAEFVPSKTKPVVILHSEQDFDDLPNDSQVFVHIPSTYFQGNERREALTRLSNIAKEKNAKLIVFATGNIATQHAARVLIGTGHTVVFIGDESIQNGEEIRMFAKDNMLMWERENPLVSHENMAGRELRRVGGKAFGLHKLEKNGYRTSPYFVLETSLFRRIIDGTGDNNPLEYINNDTSPADIKDMAQAIQDRILTHGRKYIPLLTEALISLGGERFSVRSSATCEDGKCSFAGIFKTFLNVRPDDIYVAILEVLASGGNGDAIRLARNVGIKPSQIQMSVIIQNMVDARVAGTIFTKEHISGDEGLMRIDAVRGLGETIVNGTATNHQGLVIDKKTRSIRQGNNYLNQDTVLTVDQIQELIDIGLKVERSLGEGPQDIEWAIDQNGEVILLQSRSL